MSAPALPDAADVVVVGGGIVGTATTFFLARETDLEVVLVERSRIAAGSTGDSSAILRHHYGPQELYSRMAWWSHRFYRDFEAETGQRIAHADARLVRFGEEGTTAGEYAAAGFDVLGSLDIPTSWLEPGEFESAFPMLAVDGYDFAVSDDDAGYSDGADAAGGFARAAADLGATVVTGTAVTDVLVEEGAVVGIETGSGTVACGTVVSAAGPWTPTVAGFVGVEVPLERSREQVVVLDPPGGYADRHPEFVPTTAVPGGDWYVRPDFGDGVLVATHHTGEAADPDDYDRTPDEDTLLDLVEGLTDLVPELADAGIKGRYCGVYTSTPDHDFVLDTPGPDGFVLGCGFSGHGFKHGPAIGRILAALAAGEDPPFDTSYFSLSRFDDDPAGHGLPGDNA